MNWEIFNVMGMVNIWSMIEKLGIRLSGFLPAFYDL